MMAKLEIACFNEEAAIVAAKGGANRIELCAHYELGGITPQDVVIQAVRQAISIPLFIMVRPRGGDFNYTPQEIKTMERTIETGLKLKVDGFVFGCMTSDQQVNIEANKQLIDAAGELQCTFHRAFDSALDHEEALKTIQSLGFSTLLTSGAADKAINGIKNLRKWQASVADKLCIMPGGGIRSSNIQEIRTTFTTQFYHSAAITDQSNVADLREVQALKEYLM